MRNFGIIKNMYNSLLSESIVSKNGTNKELFKKYLKNIRNNEILKTQFLVFNNLEQLHSIEESIIKDYIKENISLLSKFSKEEINNANEILFKDIKDIKMNEDYEFKTLHNEIHNLITISSSPKNIKNIVESIDTISKIRNPKEVIKTNDSLIPLSLMTNILVDKFNDKYSDISESEKVILKNIIDSKNENNEEILHTTINECVDIVDNLLLNENNLDVKDKLLQTKDKLLRTKYNDDNFIEDISKLLSLKSDLLE